MKSSKRLLPLMFTILSAGVLARAEAAPTLKGAALVEAYKTCWQMFNSKSWPEFAKCYGPKSVSVAPGLPEAKGGQEILDKHARPITTAFPDVAGELQLVLVDGPKLMSVALFKGTHTGPLAGPGGSIPATGKKIGMLVAHGIESAAGQVAAREWFMHDGGTMMAQLGVSPQPARPAQAQGAPAPTVVVASGSAQEKANLAAARKLYAAFNGRKPIADMLTDDAADKNQSLPKDVVGKQAVAEFITGIRQMSSDVKVNASTMWAAGDYVVAIARFAGVNDGAMPAMGLPAKTGKRFAVDVVEISRWRDGKLAELWPFYNGVQMAAQLGLLPPPPATAKR